MPWFVVEFLSAFVAHFAGDSSVSLQSAGEEDTVVWGT